MKFMRRSSALLVFLIVVLIAGVGIAFMQRARRVGTQPVSADGSVVKLPAGGDLQGAIEQAKPGDTIILEAGAVYEGPFTLPKKQGDAFITIQSSRLSELPEGRRVSPAQSDLFAKLQSSEAGSPIIKTATGAHHYKFLGVEISTANAKVKVYDLLRLGSDSQATLEEVPHHFVVDRSYIHGFDTQEVQRGIALNSAETSITNSYISDVHGRGYDTQAICGWNGPGPFKIVNNYLEGAGENVMFGGADPKIKNLVPSDIEIRDNHFFKPLKWKTDDPSYAGKKWTVKNIFELKNARRVVVDRNIFENNWVDAQPGSGILFTVRNDGGGAPWATIEDVTFTNNIVKNTPSALNLLGTDNLKPSGRAKKALIANNLFIGVSSTFLTMSGYPNVTIQNNTHIQNGNIMILHGEPSPDFVYQNNITIRSPKGYGVKGDNSGEGNVAMKDYLPSVTFKNNVIAGANPSQYPASNFFPSSIGEIGFTSVENYDFRLDSGSKFRKLGVDYALLPQISK